MSKPTANTKWAASATKTEPSSGEKDAGWIVGQKPPAQWLNWWMDAVDQWKVWLAAFESTVHNWTARQTFVNGINAADAGSDGVAVAGAGGSVADAIAVQGQAGVAAGTVGVKGIGANRTGAGTRGVVGVGGTGTTGGGSGGDFSGGAGSGSGSGGSGASLLGGAGGTGSAVGGNGADVVGGAIAGGSNTTGAAGKGLTVLGGSITADANGRVGGKGIEVSAGTGQNGYGLAIHAIHGDVEVDDGDIDVAIGDINVGGTINAGGDVLVAGVTHANGGLAIEAVTRPTLIHSWANFGSGYENAGFWKDPMGVVHLMGTVVSGTSGQPAFTLPAGYRPPNKVVFSGNIGSSKDSTITILTNGDVVIDLDTGYVGATSLDVVQFRT